MYDQFDKKLSDRITYVFDNYEDDSAEAGWQQLRGKFPVSKKRRLTYWLSAAAALVVMAASALFLYQKADLPDEKLANSKPALNSAPAEQFATERPAEQTQAQASEPVSAKTARLSSLAEEPSASKLSLASAAETEDTPAFQALNLVEAPMEPAAAPPVTVLKADSMPVAANQPVAAYARQNSREPVSSPVQAAESPLERLAREEGTIIEKSTRRAASGVSFGVYAGSFVSYSEGSKSSMNTGVGLSSEIPISSKLKISTGIALAQNTLKYDRTIPQQAAQMFEATSSVPKSDVLLVANPQSKSSGANYSINSYDASLLGFDIPVNLKYTLREDKQELYILAGISSNIFIDETYTYNYQYSTREGFGIYSVEQEEDLNNQSSSFDFARMLNFSVGFGYPLGKQSKLSFEPFVKYPLGGLGAQDLRFGSAGLNLKFNFSKK